MENPYEPPKSDWENPLPKDAPRLFNPTASSMFALLFGLPLACFLHAANWKALGEQKYSTANIWIGVVWIVLAVGLFVADIVMNGFESQSSSIDHSFIILGLPALLGWYFGFGRKQEQLVQDIYRKNYPRRSMWWAVLWGLVMAVGFFALFIIVAIILFFLGFIPIETTPPAG
ncbi:MAG: hypothetical protein J6U05_04275 [Neisseriaceae bacterium]|nr:hypothetical protein [Neisseriaceae bacterium]